jgi:glycosyltransferase involved in cell wall biosynthesis
VTGLRVGVYDLYWSTLGGGEQVDGTIASVLVRDHDVTLLGPDPVDVERTRERLGVDLTGCAHQVVRDDEEASEASGDFDLFVNGTYLSRAVNRARLGWYYVHFPQVPPTRWDRARHWAGVAGVRLLSSSRLPARLTEVRAGFDRRVRREEFLPTYQRYLANSRFTADWVTRLWAVPSEVLYPPVRTTVGPGTKKPLILNVGRFFDPRFGHSKKQLDLVAAFRGMGLAGWDLSLAGGCDAANRDYALAAKRIAREDDSVHVHINAPGALVEELFATASIYWHGGGYGEDLRRHPDRFEHFGITVLEAMAAGAVPLVYAAAGPAEIVRDGIDGFHWRDLDQLVAYTRRLAEQPDERVALAAAGRERVAEFSTERFASQVGSLVHQDVEAWSPDDAPVGSRPMFEPRSPRTDR